MQEMTRTAVGSALGFVDSLYRSSTSGNYEPLADMIPSELEVDWRETNDLKNKIVALIADNEQSDEYEVSRLDLVAQKRKRAYSDDIMEDVQPESFFSTLSDPTTASFDLEAPSDASRHICKKDSSQSHGNVDTIVITNLPSSNLMAGKVASFESSGKSLKKARSNTPKASRSNKPDAIPWDDWFNALRAHGETLGHCNVSRSCKVPHPDGRELKIGEWLHTQRSHKRDGTLTAERVASIQQLVDEGKVAWSLHWNTMPSEGVGLTPNDIRWEVGSRLPLYVRGRYQELLQYGEIYGDYNVPYHRADCSKTKKKFSGSSTADSNDQEARVVQEPYQLSDLSLTYTEEGYDLCEDKSVAKIANLFDDQIPLGKWLKKQRQHRQDGAIRADREAKLQALADLREGKFKWSSTVTKASGHDDKKWSENFDMLTAYGKHIGGGPGSCDVHTKTSVVNGATGESKHLGLWIKRQKRQYGRGILRAERVLRLQALVDEGLLSWSLPDPYKKGDRKHDIPVLAPTSYSATSLELGANILKNSSSFCSTSSSSSSSNSNSISGDNSSSDPSSCDSICDFDTLIANAKESYQNHTGCADSIIAKNIASGSYLSSHTVSTMHSM